MKSNIRFKTPRFSNPNSASGVSLDMSQTL